MNQQQLLTHISQIRTTTTLSLSMYLGNKTGEEWAQAFAALPATVTTLNLEGNSLGNKTGAELAQAFRALPATVTTLDLSGNGLRFRLAQAFAALPATVTTLNLSWNDLGDITGAELAQAFAALPATVTTLNLTGYFLGIYTVTELAQAFAALPATVTTLDLSSNRLYNLTGAELAQAFRALPATVTTLDLSGNGLRFTLTQAFAALPATVTTLNLSGNVLRNAGVTALADALTSGNCPYGTKIIGVNSHIDTLCELNDRMIIHKYGELVASTLVKGLSQALPIEVLKLIVEYSASVLSDDEYQEVAHYANNASQEIFSQAAFRTLFNEHSLCKKYDREARETEAKRQNIFDRQHGLVPYQH